MKTFITSRLGLLGVLALPAFAAAGLTGVPAAVATPVCSVSWTGAGGDGDWNTASNWSTSAVPVAADDVCITADGTYTVTLDPGLTAIHSLTLGGSTGVQTLAVQANNPNDGFDHSATLRLTAGGAIGAAGELALTSTGLAADQAAVDVAGGTLTNAGVLESDQGVGGARAISGNVQNAGTINLDAPLTWGGARSGTLTNQGTLVVTGSGALTISANTTLDNTAVGAGVTNSGSVALGGTTLEGAGTMAGAPVVQNGGFLDYTGTGASVIRARGTVTLLGDIGASQTLQVEPTDPTCGSPGNTNVTAQAAFTNSGTISLVSDGCGSDQASLNLDDTLTNAGVVESLGSAGTSLTVDGPFTNGSTGHVNVGSGTALRLTGLTNYSGLTETLKGGSYTVAGDLQLDQAFIRTLSASLQLLPGWGLHDQKNNNALSGSALTLIVKKGNLALVDGATLSLTDVLDLQGKLTIGSYSTLNAAGFTEETSGLLTLGIAGTNPGAGYGQLTSSGTDSLAGKAVLARDPAFVPPLGTTFQPLVAASVSGQWSKITGEAIGTTGVFFVPQYAGGVALSVNTVTIGLSPASGSAGSTLTVSGDGFSPGETINVTFGGSAVLPATADGTGHFSIDETVPVVGTGKYVVAVKGQTSLIARSARFKVV